MYVDFMTLQQTSFEIIAAKKEIAHKDQFLLLQQSLQLFLNSNWIFFLKEVNTGDHFHFYKPCFQKSSVADASTAKRRYMNTIKDDLETQVKCYTSFCFPRLRVVLPTNV